MDALFSKYSYADDMSRNPQFEDYGELLLQIEQSKAQNHTVGYPALRHQNPTPESSNEESLDQHADPQSIRAAQSMGMYPMPGHIVSQHRYQQQQQQQQQQWQPDGGFQPKMTPDSQHEDSFSPQSPGPINAQRTMMAHGRRHWSDLNGVFNSDIEQAAPFHLSQSSFVDEMLLNNQAAFNGYAMSNGTDPRMSTLSSHLDSAVTDQDTPQPDSSRMLGPMAPMQQQQQQQQQQQRNRVPMTQLGDGTFVRRGSLVIAQPMAVHGSGANQPSHVNHLNAQAERMGSRTQTRSASSMQSSVTTLGTGISGDASTSQSGSVAAQSPSASESSQEALPEVMMPSHVVAGSDTPTRRPSMTTDIARDMTHVHIKTESPEIPHHMQPIFKKPSLPQGTTLAERRRQQLPNGLNVQRPKGLNLNRAFSSSAINTAPAGGRYPTSPHATLRRNRSSNVINGAGGVLSGRIQKPGPGSARNSPLVASFPEDLSAPQLSHSQTTPTNGPNATSSQPVQSLSSFQGVDILETTLPLSADPLVYTPGLQSGGSVPGGQSWMSTPITTPYGPTQTPVPSKANWPPASAVPQSAPPNVMSFSRDMSPPTMPSMPVTPANMHFPVAQSQMHMMSNAMGPHALHVVPSQPGVSENPAFVSAQQSHLLQLQQATASWMPQAPWLSFSNDPYSEHALWLMQNSCLPQKEIEVKLDAGCQRLKDEVSEGKAKLVRIKPQEFSFQNTTTQDMKKSLEEKE